MIKGFKDFLLRGNVVDLAVAVIVGSAFGAVVTAFATDFIGGLIAAAGGVPDVGQLGFQVGEGNVIVGTTITALLNFLIVTTVVYFAVVVPVQKLMERRKRGEEPEAVATPEDIALLQEIRDLLAAQAAGTGSAGTGGAGTEGAGTEGGAGGGGAGGRGAHKAV